MNPSTLPAKRLDLFPLTTQVKKETGIQFMTIAGCDLAQLAAQYGTSLYLYDRHTLDEAVARYRAALAESYPGESGLTYAGKAFLCTGIAQWVERSGMWLDCTGEGELRIADAARIPREHLLMHGVSKSSADLQAAVARVGTLVVDNLEELKALVELTRGKALELPNLWLRFRPGLAVDTHAYTQTGQHNSKFGMSADELLLAVRVCRHAGLPLTGLHFHQGSHFHDPTPLAPALEAALDLISEARASLGWYPQVLCPGGGWGVAYHEDELPHPSVEVYVRFIAEHLLKGCRARDLPLPKLQLEPGRSLVARAGVALYRLHIVKHTPQRRWLLLDGGMADNPRPALYGARYSALPVVNPLREPLTPAWLAGPYCESGDVLIEDLPMPEVQPGELIAVPVAGAYQLSMGSNYNGARKPAVLWLEAGRARLMQRRETLDDLIRRDLPLWEG